MSQIVAKRSISKCWRILQESPGIRFQRRTNSKI